jgi:Mg2+-importing ATPase
LTKPDVSEKAAGGAFFEGEQMDSKFAQPTPPPWSLPAERVFDLLRSSPLGLSGAAAGERLEKFGPNQLESREAATPLRLFLNQFKSPLVLILVFAALVSILTGEWIDATIILLIVLASSVMGFVQEYRAGHAVEKLRQRVKLKVSVLRDDRPQMIPAEEVVPGDVLLLSAGCIIPADAGVFQADDFFVNQAVLTGETFPVEKKAEAVSADAPLTERSNCVFMGTNVRSGSARAVVFETGTRTAFGRIAEKLTLRPPETEFERGIRRFGGMLTQVMMVLVLVVFAVNVALQKPAIDSLLFSVALAVGIAPELLPAIIGITLSQGAQAMAKRGVIVRRLSAIENFGNMDVLCTDKTSTLTLGVVNLDGALDPRGEESEKVFLYAYLNARFQTGLSNPLDEAILAKFQPDIGNFFKTEEIPYDFVRKRLSIAVRDASQDKQTYTLITKGALDNVVAVCASLSAGPGTIPLDEENRAGLQKRFAEWSDKGYRVLGLATKEVAPQAEYPVEEESGMTFAGFLLFFDPPKPDALQTIADLTRLGVTLKVITGDNRRVAIHVAQITGLPVTGVVTGADLNRMGDEALWRQADRANLFVEVDPNQKERIISALRKTGHVVGYLGDGINDAPALHAADVGISVDSAVDVAKEAADFVLLERGLDVLRQGIEQGRRTFANTLKYVFTTTSANFGNMFSMAGLSLFLPFLPLLPKQILLNNFLSDLPALTIAGDNIDRELVDRPRRWDVAFIRNFMIVFGLISSAFDYLTFGILLLILHVSEDSFRTGWFVESLFTELFILLVVRTRRPLFKSRPGKWLWISTLLVGIVALVLPYLPGVGPIFGFVAIPIPMMAILLGITALYVVVNEIAKRIFFRRMP